ncbi:hypothetical protein WJX82_009835 [Trebouxia sp. C0006]
MASRVLKQLGEKAFQPLKIGDIWHKPAISAKNFAKLRRQTVGEGREWEFDQISPRAGYQRKPKGHKHDKLAALRQDEIQKNLDGMAERIQTYRDSPAFPSSPWVDAFGHYCNGEPGRPLLVSLLLYLDTKWPRQWDAETLFLDDDTDIGIVVRPKCFRAVLMDQDILHRVSTPSQVFRADC